MSFFIKTHIVQKGETIDDIVSKYDIPDAEILRYFHNHHAPENSSHIGSVVFTEQEIFIPQKQDVQKILESQKKLREDRSERKENHLKNKILYPDFLAIKNHYQVKISNYKDPGSPDVFSFDAQLRYMNQSEQNSPLFYYKKENYLINDEKPHTKLGDLATEAIQFLYPLEFSLEKNIAKPYSIKNLKEIRTRWEKTKDRVFSSYSDAYSLKYIKMMDEAMNEGLSNYILNDLFLQFFFSPYVNYKNGNYEGERNFHTYRILYQDTMQMQITADEIHIEQQAYCTDPRTPQQILDKWIPDEEDMQEESDNTLESYIKGAYILDKNYKILKKANIELQTNFYEEETIQIEINIIER
ncbi:LysM domain-containing protein [Chryseobacterium sp. T9W2-O]|uniref:LysM domain-containing protein n=1 Tax=Chryseobacterium salviniae TaxID=3101750 RepID=A0ABU6HMA6_9FLAO|nr:LysM domain-containing protein [Chryseobacterium sp. T9W2-O]